MKEFYPTPKSLAIKAIGKFKNKIVTRLLEPEAGRGDLAKYAADELLLAFCTSHEIQIQTP
tara:strand:- start:2241 stop:2423 length:183 start_codon:yes stop_codon:yes gene_type:complete